MFKKFLLVNVILILEKKCLNNDIILHFMEVGRGAN